ncbi:MAG: DUF2480 family protein [Salibacteraceae bacterium]
MAEDEIIENKVAKSGLITLDLEVLKPEWDIVGFDMANVLWQRTVLKEKEFRGFVKNHVWEEYSGKAVYIYSSEDAIIPTWAYMLLATALKPHVLMSVVGTKEDMLCMLWRNYINDLDMGEYRDARVVLKGCSNEVIPETVYHELTSRLVSNVRSLMFGEPCSTVPVFKKK